MENIKVIALVGMPGAGKSFCVDHLSQKGWPSVYFGGVTIDEIKKRGLEVNEANEKLVREDIRATEGTDAYAVRMIKKIERLASEGHHVVIADGLYSWSEYKIFKERFGDDVAIVAITAPRKVRHQRLSTRPVRPLTAEDATSRDYAEIENIEKGGPIANADFTVTNNTTTHSMIDELESVLVTAGIN